MKYAWSSLLCLGLLMGSVSTVSAQTAFWSFDENQQESMIPAQCDGRFDEARGGVFLPTAEEMFEQGEAFLAERGANRNNAGYCFIASALQGNIEAQFRLAQLYNKGIILPQDDLSAYKWAFIASLNGHKEAERLALMLESFLSTEDIELATKSIESLLPQIKSVKTQKLSEADKTLSEKMDQLDELNKEIDSILGIPATKVPRKTDQGFVQKTIQSLNSSPAVESAEKKGTVTGALKTTDFTESDRYAGQ